MTRSNFVLGGFALLGGVILYSFATGGSPESPVESLTPTVQGGGENTDPSGPASVREESPRLEVEPVVQVAGADQEEAPDVVFSDDIPEWGSCNYGALPWDDYPGDYQELLQVPKSVWEEKYAGFSEGDLAGAKGRIRAQFFSTTKTAVEERRSAGLVTVFPRKYKTTPSGDQKPIPFHLKKSGNIPLHQVTSYPATEDKGSYTEFIWFPPDEYPDLYLLASEAMWLGAQVPQD